MRILFDINHPADVHQFCNVIRKLEKEHDVKVVARARGCVFEILKEKSIEFIGRKGYTGMMKVPGIIFIDFKLYGIAKQFNPDVLVGSSGNLYAAHAAKLLGKRSVIFDDTEHAKFQQMLCFPFADKIVTPESYRKDLGKKQVRYKGSKELAYLDRRYFKPKSLKKLGLKKGYVFLRLVSWDANHDMGRSGIKDVKKIMDSFDRVYISSERALHPSLKEYELPHTHDLHSIMYHADLVISEGGTVAVESAVLGAPTLYVNELSMGYSDALIKEGRMVQTTKDIVKKGRKMIKKRKKPIKLDYDLVEFMVGEIVN